MKLSPTAVDRLKAWLGTETWSSGHALDRQRLYGFVDQCALDGERAIDTDELLAEAKAAFGFAPNEFQLGKLTKFVDLANDILHFLSFTGRM